MKVLMLGWELPPHNSGGLGVACYQMCKSLSSAGVSIDFIVPYTDEHNIDFMNVIPAVAQDVREAQRFGIAYDSTKFIFNDGHCESLSLTQQHAMYEAAIDRIVKLDDITAKEVKATHKIVGTGGDILCLAITGDDKLKQQEGNSVTMVGTIPYDKVLGENTVLNVKYISFK